MDKPYILHLLTAARHASPFDVNMACDAGYDVVVPYVSVELDEVAALTQDAIFSRGPSGAKRTAIYIGGRDIGIAADMLAAARRAMVPPFAVSVFADPSGAFTTAAAMIACVERRLRALGQPSLAGLDVVVPGGTGPVGSCAAVLAAQAGARTTIAGRRLARAQDVARDLGARYGVAIGAAEASDASSWAPIVAGASVLLACGPTGVRMLGAAELAAASKLLVAADVNAVPPAGVEGIGAMDDGTPLAAGSGKAVGIGALAVGNVKYTTQRRMLESMRAAEKPQYLDFRDAFVTARALTESR